MGGGSGEPRRAAIWTSRDGLAWSLVPDGPAFSGHFTTYTGLPGVGGAIALASNATRIVAVGGLADETGFGEHMQAAAWSSVDGETWERTKLPAANSAFALDVAAGPDGFTAVGVWCSHCVGTGSEGAPPAPGTEAARLWRSTDGVTWRAVSAPALRGSVPFRVAWTGTRLLAIGERTSRLRCPNCVEEDGTNMWSSPDGITWSTVRGLPRGFDAMDLVASTNGAVFTVPLGSPLFRSRDGVHWSRGRPPAISNGGISSGSFIPGGYLLAGVEVVGVGCCSAPAFFTSSDGSHWSSFVMPAIPDAFNLEHYTTASAVGGRTIVVGGYYGDVSAFSGEFFVAANGVTP